jgi:beta-lactam-binding protein with PASTA domain
MAPTPGQSPVLVTVPDLLRLSARTARDFAHRSQLVAVGPDPDAGATTSGIVVEQQPAPGVAVPRWSTVVIWTSGGPGDAGVREPRRPSPPPLSVQEHLPEHAPEPPPGPAHGPTPGPTPGPAPDPAHGQTQGRTQG